MCTSLCVMNRGRLLASGTSTRCASNSAAPSARSRSLCWTARRRPPTGWARQPAVHDVRVSRQQVVFGFTGDDEAQADLVDGLIAPRLRLRAFEEKRSSFEDILVEVAENNRHS